MRAGTVATLKSALEGISSGLSACFTSDSLRLMRGNILVVPHITAYYGEPPLIV